jgi:hypothetical protein
MAVPPPLEDGGVIATMWARRTIQSLEEVNNLRTVRMRKAKLTREQETLVNLSKEFALLCSLTTFIAVEHRSVEERNEGRPELRRVPVQVAKGWGGMDVGTGLVGMACAGPIVLSSLASPPASTSAPYAGGLYASSPTANPCGGVPAARPSASSSPARWVSPRPTPRRG